MVSPVTSFERSKEIPELVVHQTHAYAFAQVSINTTNFQYSHSVLFVSEKKVVEYYSELNFVEIRFIFNRDCELWAKLKSPLDVFSKHALWKVFEAAVILEWFFI